MYDSRLKELRPRAEAAAVKRWGASILEQKTKTLDAEPDEPVMMTGTVYVDMKLKPNILDNLKEDIFEKKKESDPAAKYCGEGDVLMIEDDSGRVAMRVPAELLSEIGPLVTGMVVSVRGKLSEAGELHVDGLCVPGMPPQRALRPPSGGERYVALVSGLHLGHGTQDMLPLQLLAEHLTGALGCDEDHRMQANIVRLIIAGNAAARPVDALADGSVDASATALKKVSNAGQQALAQTVRTLDQFLTAVSAAIPVDLMPGADDPANFLLPQQPLHPCLLPHSSQLATLNMCTNPYCCDVDGVRIVGSSGQPLDDMLRYAEADDRLALLGRSLEYQHLAPTAPDTLGCFPFEGRDPFVVKECPHIYFAGNQPAYETAELSGPEGQRVRTVLVPDFAKEHTCVLVNLDTLECTPLSFAGLDAM